MLHDRFILDSAASIAGRVREMAGAAATLDKKIEAAYLIEFARRPSAAEVKMSEEYLAAQAAIYANANVREAQAALRALLDGIGGPPRRHQRRPDRALMFPRCG